VSALRPEAAAGRLAGRTALVVGGGSTHEGWPGTGTATARLLAAAGARVAVMGRNRENTERTVRDITEAGGEAMTVQADATVEADVDRAVTEVVERFGGLDVLVNNLGVSTAGALDDLAVEDWHGAVRSNLTSVLLVTKRARPLLADSSCASIVNVGSVAGMRASGSIAYGTTKGALEAMTRELALELGAAGIRVNMVVPGHMYTPSGSQFMTDDARRLRVEMNMLGVEGTAWDIAWAALFLAGDESRFITSTTLVVDAGAAQSLPLLAVARDRARSAAPGRS
jgi:NAD(P)-dependent dehydrogenase (short-subunit alcohol dehydrogenase family)